MASTLERIRLRREGLDAPLTEEEAAPATESTLEAIRNARKRAQGLAIDSDEVISDEIPLTEELTNMQVNRRTGVDTLPQLKEGTKDIARQIGTFTSVSAEVVAMRNMAEETLAAERETPFSTFGPGVQARDEFLRTLPKDPAKRKEILEDPAKFAQARVNYIVENNTEYADQARKVRGYIQERLKADPEYLQSTGWIEDFIRMGPQVGAQVVAGLLTGGAGSAALMFAQISGATTEKLMEEGVDAEQALTWGMVNAAAQAPMESFALGKLTGVMKAKGRVLGKIKKLGEAMGTEWITEFSQSYPDAAAEIMAKNPTEEGVKKWEMFLDKALTLEHTKGAAKEATIASLWGGIFGGPSALNSNPDSTANIETPEAAASDLIAKPGMDVRTVEEGVHIARDIDEIADDVADFEKAEEAADNNPSSNPPTVRNLLGIEDAGINDSESSIGEPGEGIEIGATLDVTPVQAETQHDTNDTITTILEDMTISKGLDQQREKILQGQETLNNLEDGMTEALILDDHQTALQYAENYQKVAGAIAQNVEKFMLNRQAKVENNDNMLDPKEVEEVGTYSQALLQKADELLTGQQKAVAAQEAIVNMEAEEIKQSDPKVFKQAIQTAEETTKDGSAKKLYREISDMQELKENVTDEYYAGKTLKPEKLVKMKGDLERKIKAEASDRAVDPDIKSTDEAALSWVNEQIREKTIYDANKDLEAINAERQKILQEKHRRITSEQVTGTKPPVERVKSTADRKAEQAKAAQEQVATKAEQAKQAAVQPTTKLAERLGAVRKIQTPKPTATPGPLSTRKTRKTRRETIKRQRAQLAKKVSKPTTLPKGKKIDLQKTVSKYELNVKPLKKERIVQAKGPKGRSKAADFVSAESKATIRKALVEDAPLNKFVRKIQKITGTQAEIIDPSEINNLDMTQGGKDMLRSARGAFRSKKNKIYLNAFQMRDLNPSQIRQVMAHETIHSELFRGLANVSKDGYRKGMKDVANWWDNVSALINDDNLKLRDDRVKGFVAVMNHAAERVRATQDALEAGKPFGLQNLDKALIGMEEGLTYAFTSPTVAKYLNGIKLPSEMRTSKVKTLWDWLVNHMLAKFGQKLKKGSALSEITAVANNIMKLGDVVEPGARFSKEALDFDFGANINKGLVENWAKDLDSKAANAIPTQVVQDHKAASDLVGFEVDKGVSSIWVPARTVKRKVFTGTKAGRVEKTNLPAQVVIIADNIESQEHLTAKWMHEQVAHQGLRNVFGDNTALFNRFLDQIQNVVDQNLMNEIIELYDIGKLKNGKRTLTKTEKRLAVEETLARRYESMKPKARKGIVAKFKQFLAKWLPKNFIGKPKTFQFKEAHIDTIMKAARENVLTGDTQFGDLMNKALEARKPTFEFKGWETLPAFAKSDKTYKNWMKEVAKANPDIRHWYQKHTDTLKETFGKDADLFNILLSVTSPQADVNTNVVFAAQTYAYLLGKTHRPGALFANKLKKRIDQNWTSPDNMLKDLESTLFKVTEFNRALAGDASATVGDLWMYRAFFGDHAVYNKENESYSVPQVVAMRQKIHDLASQMTEETGEVWTPREVQAAIWVHINAKSNGIEFSEVADYQSGFNKPSQKFGGKTPLEWLDTLVPNMSDGPLSDHIGLKEIPMAPVSPLAKKRLLQLSNEPGVKTKPVKDLAGAQKYIRAQKASKYAPVLTISTPKKLLAEIENGKRQVHMTADGKAGWSVDADGDIQMVFSNSDKSGVGTQMVIEAIAAGGISLDAYDGFLPSWYKQTFGFKEVDRWTFDPKFAPKGWDKTPLLKDKPDVVLMQLYGEPLNLFSDAKGNVKPNLIRENLGGYSGTYTQVARFSRDARKNLDDIAHMSQEDMKNRDADLIRTGNDGSSVLGKIHEWRDQSARNIDRMADSLEQEFLELFGDDKNRVAGFIRGTVGSGRLINTAKTEELNKAMNLYVDSGTGKNRAKVEAYFNKLQAKGEKNITNRELEHARIIKRMMKMDEREIAWAEDNIRTQYENFFDFAQENKIIDSHVDNYVKRQWKMPKELKDADITWNGTGTSGFKLTPSSGKPRSFDSIIDGWEAGMDLRGSGAIQNMQEYANEVGYVYANRRFTEYMRGLIQFKSGALMHEVNVKQNPGFKPPAGMIQITDQGFAKPFHKLYARKQIATEINKLGRRPTHELWDTPVLRGIRKVNAMLKSTILSVSLFHHFAGLRSYIFGVSGKGTLFKPENWKNWNPIKAYRRGLEKLEKQTGLTDPKYAHLGPVADLLVREGLTVGRTQDWDQAAIQDSILEDKLLGMQGKASAFALENWQKARRLKRSLTTGLFGRLFAGLKVESGAMELVHKLEKAEAKKGEALTDAEIKHIAQQVAALINADFGGLHLSRMGRNPDLQRVAQMLLLAPDWTESNWRTVTGMAPKLNSAINKTIGDNKELEGMTKVYQKFWGGIAARGALSVIAFNAFMYALVADDDEREEYVDFLVNNMTSLDKIGKGRWLAADITPLRNRVREVLGLEKAEKRRVVSVMGHFKDILKISDPRSLIKHKVSPIASTFESLWSGTDWKGSRFTTIDELVTSGWPPPFTAEGGKYAKDVSGLSTWSTLPSILGYRLRQSLPIFAGQFLEIFQRESEWLPAIARAGGLDVRDVSHQPAGQRKFEEVRGEVNKLDRNLKVAKEARDQGMIREAQKDIRAYKGFNKAKSRVNFARKQLSAVNKSIKALEAKQEEGRFTKTDERRLAVLELRRQKIYDKFNKVIDR